MKTLFPAASVFTLVALVASVGYAESQSTSRDDVLNNVSQQATTKKSTSSTNTASQSGTASTVAELSVPPMDHVEYPEDRPDWVSEAPDLSSKVHTWAVTSAGCETVEQCEEELDVLVRAAVALYIRETTGWICDDSFLDDTWIETELIGARYGGTLVRGDTQLHELAVQLRFDSAARQRIADASQASVLGERLRAVAGLFTLGLIGLCCTGGLLSVFSRRYAG